MRRSHTPKRWRTLPGDTEAEARLQQELGLHPIVARLLAQRGITTPEAADLFLNPSLDRLHDPFLLPDVEAACERLKIALAKQEKILVHGDYDADGVTSAALWTRALRSLGGQVEVFVPHRKRDGYDMRVPIIKQARQDGVTLIVTTDCGIQRVEEVEHARQAGIDVIITDHHTPNASGELPQAVAIINPHRKDSRYPFANLAGVGVAFKVCEALTRYLGHKPEAFRRGFLDLAAIGTVQDIMPLLDENRIIVKHGLEALQNSRKPGLRALIDVAGYNNGRPLDANAIGFGIGPRLNAAGRMDDSRLALDLLLTKDDTEAQRLARRINELNSARKDEESRILEEALEQLARQDSMEARCLVLHGQGWQSGLIGLVANKIVARYHRPVVMIALDEATGSGRGSARSIHAFHMLDAMEACRDLLIEYGGHAHAAGLAIEGANVEDFAAQMNRIAGAALSDEDLVPSIEIAQEIGASEISADLICQLEALAPFGSANREPYFVSRSVPILEVKPLSNGKHVKLLLKSEGLDGREWVEALWWNNGHMIEGLQSISSLDICYRAEFNHFNGRRRIQFVLEDISPPEW